MMKIELFMLALFVGLFSTQSLANGMFLNVQKNDDLIIVSIVNKSQQDVKVSKWFTQNMAFGLIEFNIHANGRRYFPLTGPNEDYPVASNYVVLAPLDVIGRAFYVSDLRKLYRVEKQCFDLAVEYHDIVAKKFMAYQGTLRSNEIHVCG